MCLSCNDIKEYISVMNKLISLVNIVFGKKTSIDKQSKKCHFVKARHIFIIIYLNHMLEH